MNGIQGIEAKRRQVALNQALSLRRDSFRVQHSLTCDTVRGEEASKERGILDSRWSFFTVYTEVLIITFFDVSSELSQLPGEKSLFLLVLGILLQIFCLHTL